MGATGLTSINPLVGSAAINIPPMVGPLVGGTVNTSYSEQAAAVFVDSTIPVSDADSATLVGATVTIASGFQSGDVLHFVDQSGIVGQYDVATHLLTLRGLATGAQYQAALQSVTFDNLTNDDPTAAGTSALRTIRWQVDDGADLSNIYQTFINVTAVNDVPLVPRGGGQFDSDHSTGHLLRRDDGTLRIDDVDANKVSAHVLGAVGNEWRVLGTGDFNGDGVDDILSQRATDHMLVVHAIADDRVAAHWFVGQVGGEWNFLGAGDFNHDGTDDLLWQRGDGALLVHDMRSNQVVGSALPGRIGTEWHFLAIDDFNHDGTGDLLWQRGDGMLLIQDMQSNHVSDNTLLGQIGSDWHFAGTGDFNGDDTGDLLFQRDDGTLRVYDIVNNRVASSQVLETLAGDTRIAGIGDYTGDGTDDLVLRHDNGTFELQRIQANAVTQTVNLGQVGNEWHIV